MRPEWAAIPLGVEDYYRDPAVRSRLLEYCGGGESQSPTAAYVAILRDDGMPYLSWERSVRVPPLALLSHLDRAADLSRSLWDASHLLFILDVDYQNVDLQGHAFTHPVETFLKLEPTYRATRAVLAALGFRARRLMTGRGYHFTGRIPLTRPVVDQLASFVPETPGWHGSIESRRPTAVTAPLSERQARATAGLGLLTEYLTHLVLRRAARESCIPIVVNGTVVGRGLGGRESVSLDFSHAGDPLDTRTMRIAFSAYQWHRFRPDTFGRTVADYPPLVALPRDRRSLFSMLLAGRGLDAGVRAAHRDRSWLPDVSIGIERLAAKYSRSRLGTFHREFQAGCRQNQSDRPTLDPGRLLPCVAASLRTPNDLLLKPEHSQHLTRALLARGWSAPQIARLVRAHYESDWNWGSRWARMHPATRAEFDVRVFAGMIVSGVDRMVDFNCVSAQEKGLCPRVACRHDLRADRDALFARVHT